MKALRNIVEGVSQFLELLTLNRQVAYLATVLLAATAITRPGALLEVAATIIALGVLYLSPVVLRMRNDVRNARTDLAAMRDLLEEDRLSLVFLDLERSGPDDVILAIELFGTLPVRDVAFVFEPPLVNSRSENIGSVPPLSPGIPVLRPGDRIEVPFDTVRSIRERMHLSGMSSELEDAPSKPLLKTRATVRFSPADRRGSQVERSIDLDLAPLLELR